MPLRLSRRQRETLEQRAADGFIDPQRLIELEQAMVAVWEAVDHDHRQALVIVFQEIEELFAVRVTQLETQ